MNAWGKLAALVAAVLIAAAPVRALDSVPGALPVTTIPAPTQASQAAPAPAGDQPVSDNGHDVWWGNRAISYGNYLKFTRIDSNCTGACKVCDQNMRDCDTGCPCATCEKICQDCDCAPDFAKIFFDDKKGYLRPEGRAEIQKVVTYLNAHPNKDVVITAPHADITSAQWTARAKTVQQYLVENGVNSSRVSTATGAQVIKPNAITIGIDSLGRLHGK